MSPDNGAHTTFPVFGLPIPSYQQHSVMKTRDFVIVASEQGRGDHCAPGPNGDRPAPHLGFLVDITNEATPWNLSTFHVDERQGDFCGKGGRFGAHAAAESFYPPFYGKLAIFSWFNAGTRVFDIRNPFDVREIGYFIPAVNKNTMSFCVDGISHPDGDPKITAGARGRPDVRVEIDDRGLVIVPIAPDLTTHLRLTVPQPPRSRPRQTESRSGSHDDNADKEVPWARKCSDFFSRVRSRRRRRCCSSPAGRAVPNGLTVPVWLTGGGNYRRPEPPPGAIDKPSVWKWNRPYSWDDRPTADHHLQDGRFIAYVGHRQPEADHESMTGKLK